FRFCDGPACEVSDSETLCCRNDSGGRPFEQLCAVVFFQIPDLAARCRVRDEDRLRGKMDRPVFGDGEQGLETAEIGHRGRPSAGCDSRVRWWCNNRTTSVREMHPGVDGSGCLCHSTSARLAVMSEEKTGREVAADSTGTRADLARSA